MGLFREPRFGISPSPLALVAWGVFLSTWMLVCRGCSSAMAWWRIEPAWVILISSPESAGMWCHRVGNENGSMVWVLPDTAPCLAGFTLRVARAECGS